MTTAAASPATVVRTTNPDALLVRAIGVRQLAATIFNYTVASGIFALPATAAAQLGTAAPLAYVVCTAIMLLVVASFAEAGSRVSSTGGPYAYIEAAFGPFIGLLSGVFLVVSALSGVAVVSTLFAGSALALAHIPATSAAQAVIVIAVSAAAVVFNVCGVQWGVRVVEFMTAAKLIPLLLFVGIGAAFIHPANFVWTNVPDATAILGTSGIVIFAFMGIESGLGPSGEVRDPSRTVPRAAFLALLGVCALYLSVQAVAQGILGARLASTEITPLAEAAGAAVGEPGRMILLVGATVSMLGLLCGAGLVNPRIVFALARDGFLPRYISGVHPVYRTPHRSIVLCAIVVVSLALTGTFERLLIISNITGLIVYAMVALAAMMLRRRDIRADGEPFRCPGGVLVHLAALGGVVWMLWAIVSRQDLVGVAILLGVTGVAYLLRRRPGTA
jgi:basic amino acid/polyamine antiporter, APA family